MTIDGKFTSKKKATVAVDVEAGSSLCPDPAGAAVSASPSG
jgi:hypothetical protein